MLTVPKIWSNFGTFSLRLFFSICSYKKLMSLELTDTDIRSEFDLKLNTKGITFFIWLLRKSIFHFFFNCLCKVSFYLQLCNYLLLLFTSIRFIPPNSVCCMLEPIDCKICKCMALILPWHSVVRHVNSGTYLWVYSRIYLRRVFIQPLPSCCILS